MSDVKKAIRYMCVASGSNDESYASDRLYTVQEALDAAKHLVLNEWEEDDLEGFEFVVYTVTSHQVFNVENSPRFIPSPVVNY